MRRALICVTLLIALCSNRGVYRMALRSRKGVLVPAVPIPMCHLWSTDGYQFSISHFCYTVHVLFIHCLQVVKQDYGVYLNYNRHKEKSEILQCKFVHLEMPCRTTHLLTYIVMLNKENVHLFLNWWWHIHSVSLNLISVLQTICPKQLCMMRKGCLCCVFLHYETNSSHESFTHDLTVTYVSLKCCCLRFTVTSCHDMLLNLLQLPLYRQKFRKVNL